MSFRFIGRSVPRTDNTDKVTGAARYTSDVLLPGTLWAKTLRSPYSHARIKRIDTSRAETAPGVRAILTGKDVRGILYGRHYRDISVLAQDRVRFMGERVAAVAAEMGVLALFIYLAFLVTPFRRLRKIEQETWSAKDKPSIHYLAIGLQASLVAYMVVSFFASVAYLWYAYYLVAYCICVRRVHAGSLEDLPSICEPKFSGEPLNNRRAALRPTTAGVHGGR